MLAVRHGDPFCAQACCRRWYRVVWFDDEREAA